MEQSRVKYQIAYDKTRQLVSVYPQWRGPRPNMHIIGDYLPENPRANLEDYVKDLGNKIRDALALVGQPDIDPFKVMITPLDGTAEVMAKDFGGPLKRVAVEDQVPVGLNTTAAMVADQEAEKGEGEEVPSQVTSQVTRQVAREEATERKSATKKTVTKKKA